MNHVLILQHAAHEGPGFFAELLHEHQLDFRILRLDLGDPLPDHTEHLHALVMMGGPMSVNDEHLHPWLAPEMALIRQAVARGIPTLGHCLGGQLISKALGGVVSRNAVSEIGWHPVEAVTNSPWLADLPPRFTLFHWHGETFSLPPGAVHLLRNTHCENQAFAIGDHVLAFQCHPEMTADMVRQWTQSMNADLQNTGDAVQNAAQICTALDEKITSLNQHARRLYQHWFEHLLSAPVMPGPSGTIPFLNQR